MVCQDLAARWFRTSRSNVSWFGRCYKGALESGRWISSGWKDRTRISTHRSRRTQHTGVCQSKQYEPTPHISDKRSNSGPIRTAPSNRDSASRLTRQLRDMPRLPPLVTWRTAATCVRIRSGVVYQLPFAGSCEGSHSSRGCIIHVVRRNWWRKRYQRDSAMHLVWQDASMITHMPRISAGQIFLHPGDRGIVRWRGRRWGIGGYNNNHRHPTERCYIRAAHHKK